MSPLSNEVTEVLSAVELSKQIVFHGEPLEILRSATLTLQAAESVAIVGASGSGKSTLLSLLAGLDHPSDGHIALFGMDLNSLSEDKRAQLRRERIGFVFQNFQLMPQLTALENVMLPLELSGRKDAHDVAAKMLERVGLLHRLRHYPRQMSGGEQQRVALARAFVIRPRLLFADEPTGNLDPHSGRQIIDLLFQMNAEQGTALVLVTHDTELASRCDAIYRLVDGQLNGARG